MKEKAKKEEPVISTTDVEKKLDVADNALTKLGVILKKHWGKLLLILFGYVVYWAFTQPAPIPDEPVYQDEQVYDQPFDASTDTVYYDENNQIIE